MNLPRGEQHDTWDLVVVGAGPAGAATARGALAESPDLRVLLLDRADFPRDKCCGDGIAPHVLDVLRSVGVDDVTDGWTPLEHLELSREEQSVTGRMSRPVWVIPREVFDDRLVDHGKSSKPSDGMKTAFPKYNYEDMVDAQYRLLKEGLGVKHLRLVIGNSMGGMHTWIWGGKYPQFMDALVPMASQPTEMAARNWMLRRMMLETIRNDPDYNGGNYTAQPRMMKYAISAYGIATGGGTLAYQAQAPTAAKADKMVDDRLKIAITADANDFIYQWEASRDYNPVPTLEKIEATLLLINAADDERNPPETGITDAALKRVKHGRLFLIPASSETRGHLTTGNAAFYKKQVEELLQTAPQRAM